jgi:hypothetical protein
MGHNTVLGVMMIVVGLVLVSGGVVVLTRKTADPSATITPSFQAPDNSLSPRSQQAPEEKGRKFEEWVVKKFNPAYFAIKDWRGDKYVDGIHAESSEFPDLEIEFRLRDQGATFAVECKWRNSFNQGEKPGIEWASERQIANYQRFQRERGMPVFVLIGIGGEPDNPAVLYIVSLDRLKFPFASAEYLAKFRRTNTKTDFYYDKMRPELR